MEEGIRRINKKSSTHAQQTGPINEDFVKKGARGITIDDINKVVNRADDIRKRFNRKGPLGRFIEDGQLLLAIVRDYWTGKYRRIPFFFLTVIVFSLLYVLNPFDLIPDAIPILGQIDDASVITICLLMVEQELHNYQNWRNNAQTKSE